MQEQMIVEKIPFDELRKHDKDFYENRGEAARVIISDFSGLIGKKLLLAAVVPPDNMLLYNFGRDYCSIRRVKNGFYSEEQIFASNHGEKQYFDKILDGVPGRNFFFNWVFYAYAGGMGYEVKGDYEFECSLRLGSFVLPASLEKPFLSHLHQQSKAFGASSFIDLDDALKHEAKSFTEIYRNGLARFLDAANMREQMAALEKLQAMNLKDKKSLINRVSVGLWPNLFVSEEAVKKDEKLANEILEKKIDFIVNWMPVHTADLIVDDIETRLASDYNVGGFYREGHIYQRLREVLELYPFLLKRIDGRSEVLG